MTRQEFKNTFTVSEKKVNVSRLKEQYTSLEMEVRNALRQFNAKRNEIWAIQTANMLKELESYGKDLSKLKENDTTDRRYVISEAVSRISQEFDRIGGNERLEDLRQQYFKSKEMVEELMPSVDIEKEEMNADYRKITDEEGRVLLSRNPAILQNNIIRLEKLYGNMLWNNSAHIVTQFYFLKTYQKKYFENYREAKRIFIEAEKAIEDNRYMDLRRLISYLYSLLRSDSIAMDTTPEHNFKGM